MTTVRDLQALPDKGLVYNLVVTVDSVGPVTSTWSQQYNRNDNKTYLKMRDSEGTEIWADLYLNDQETASLGNPPSIEHLRGQSYTLTPWTSRGRQGGVEKYTSNRDGSPRLRLKGLSVFVPYGTQPPRSAPAPTSPHGQGPRPASGPSRTQSGPSGPRPAPPAQKPTWEETERTIVTATRGIYLALREVFPAGESAIDRPSPDAFLEAAESIAVHLSIAAQRGDVQRPVVAPRPQLTQPAPYKDPAWVSGAVEGAQGAPVGGGAEPPAPWDDWPEEGGGA